MQNQDLASLEENRMANGLKAFSAIKETLEWLKRLQKNEGRKHITIQEARDEILDILQEHEIEELV